MRFSARLLSSTKEGNSIFQGCKPAPLYCILTRSQTPKLSKPAEILSFTSSAKSWIGFNPIFLARDFWKKYSNLTVFYPEIQDRKISVSCIWLTPRNNFSHLLRLLETHLRCCTRFQRYIVLILDSSNAPFCFTYFFHNAIWHKLQMWCWTVSYARRVSLLLAARNVRCCISSMRRSRTQTGE